jgi:hypothetical protein
VHVPGFDLQLKYYIALRYTRVLKIPTIWIQRAWLITRSE